MSEENLATLLAKREHARPNRITWALLTLLVLMVGFMGGAVASRTFGPPVASGFLGPLPAMPSGLALPGGGSTPPGMTLGTVKRVDGSNLYLTTAAGATVKVIVPETASVTSQADTALVDLTKGATVIVRGEAAPDGTAMATSVSEEGTVPASPAQGANCCVQPQPLRPR